jgi:uncharacterized coiled-coil DUF342 family protein
MSNDEQDKRIAQLAEKLRELEADIKDLKRRLKDLEDRDRKRPTLTA